VSGGSALSLHPGERVIARLVANHVQNARPIDGRLYVTAQRLVFVVWPAGAAAGGVPWSVPWSEVSATDVAPRGSAREGAIRRRLRVTTASGQAEYFVVWRPAKAARIVEQALRGYQQGDR
jgi:hypothetical protein